MGIQFKGGMILRGVQLRGAEFLLPTDIATCMNWYKWKEGITSDVNGVSSWTDSGGLDNIALTQTTNARKPTYNAATGLIQFDGVDDYLRNPSALSVISTGFAECTIVCNSPGMNALGSTIHRIRHTAADADNLALGMASNASVIPGRITRGIAVGGGLPMQTVNGTLPITNDKIIVGWSLSQAIFLNGVECAYAVATKAGYADTSVPRWTLGARSLNTSGVPQTPDAYNTLGIYEMCMHNKRLSVLERTKLVNYFKVKHGII